MAAAVGHERQERQREAIAAAQSSGWFALLPLSRSAAGGRELCVPRSIMEQWKLQDGMTTCMVLPSDGSQLYGTIHKDPRGSGMLKQGWAAAGRALGGLQVGDLLHVRGEPHSSPLRLHLALTRPAPQPQMPPLSAPLIVTVGLIITEADCRTGQLLIPGAAWEALHLGRHVKDTACTACNVTVLLSGETFSGTVASSGSSSGCVGEDSMSGGGSLITGWSQAGKALGVRAGDVLFLRTAEGAQPLNLQLHSCPASPHARRMLRQRQQRQRRLQSSANGIGRRDVAPRGARSLLLPPSWNQRQAAQVSSPGNLPEANYRTIFNRSCSTFPVTRYHQAGLLLYRAVSRAIDLAPLAC